MASTRNDPELGLQGTYTSYGDVPIRSMSRKPLTGRFALAAADRRARDEANSSELGRVSDLRGTPREVLDENIKQIRAIRSGESVVSNQVKIESVPEPVDFVEQQKIDFE